MKGMRSVVVAVAAATVLAAGAAAASISGAGATFPFPIYSLWANAYQKVSGIGLNYQSIGSGGGIAQIRSRTVSFGASDMPLTPPVLGSIGLAQFPTVIGGVVPVVNVAGVGSGQLVLNGPILAAIYLGKIVKWNDPAIKRLNPKLNLPNQAIAVVHRSDGSGTTFIFTTYLSRMNAVWAKSVGANTSVDWPVGIGAKGNEGVAGNVRLTGGSIGYVEYAYAKQSHLSFTRMINRSGAAVLPTADTFQAAAANEDWSAAARQNFYVILVDEPGATSWPITATTYILVYKHPSDPKATAAVLRFFGWAFANGGSMALKLDYVPLPPNAVRAVEQSWKQVQGSGM